MKKLLFVITSIFVIMASSCIFANSGDGWGYDENTKTLTISNNDGVTNWKNDENGINEIGITDVENIVIENTVTELPDYAFENYNCLKKLSLSSEMTTIPYASFAHCTSLEEIIIPDSVTNIGDYTFNECRSAKNIKLGTGLKEIGFSAFSQSDSIETLIIPDNVTKIGTYAFCDAISLKILSIGSGVKDIGWYAFSSSKNLNKVIFNGALPSIDNSFYDTPENKTIYVVDSYVTEYGDYFKEENEIEIKTLNKGAILDIEKTFSVENVDTYTIYFNDGSTFEFTITNGENGKDSLAPKIKINETTNEWEVSYDDGSTWESLGVVATGENGKDGTDGKNGTNVVIRGENGITPKLRISEITNEWEVSYDNEKTWTSLGVVAKGEDGADGKDGIDGVNGEDGQDCPSMDITVYIVAGVAVLSLIMNIILIIVLKNKSVI